MTSITFIARANFICSAISLAALTADTRNICAVFVAKTVQLLLNRETLAAQQLKTAFPVVQSTVHHYPRKKRCSSLSFQSYSHVALIDPFSELVELLHKPSDMALQTDIGIAQLGALLIFRSLIAVEHGRCLPEKERLVIALHRFAAHHALIDVVPTVATQCLIMLFTVSIFASYNDSQTVLNVLPVLSSLSSNPRRLLENL